VLPVSISRNRCEIIDGSGGSLESDDDDDNNNNKAVVETDSTPESDVDSLCELFLFSGCRTNGRLLSSSVIGCSMRSSFVGLPRGDEDLSSTLNNSSSVLIHDSPFDTKPLVQNDDVGDDGPSDGEWLLLGRSVGTNWNASTCRVWSNVVGSSAINRIRWSLFKEESCACHFHLVILDVCVGKIMI